MTYRQKIFEELLKNNKPQLIITDGPYAQKEITKLVPQEFPIISISRQGSENSYGLQEAAEKINQLKLFSTIDPTPKMANIPRSHLGFMSRVWEGTSGSRVLNSTTPSENGIAFAVVVPSWAFTQKSVIQDKEERIGVERLKTTLESNKIYLKKDTFKTTQPDQ